MERPPMDAWRIAVAVILVFALVSTLTWLQGRFDSSDHKKAEELVKTYRARPNGPSIPELLMRRHPHVTQPELSWTSEITSGCVGSVRVRAYVPKKGDQPAASYAFDVLLTDPSIHPTDPQTVQILKEL